MTAVLVLGLAGLGASAATSGQSTDRQLNEELLREMIEFRSSAAFPDEILALLERVAERLEAAGFDPDDVEIVTNDGIANLVARYRGEGTAAPVLTMAHVDVVDAEPDAWQVHPFRFAELDGFYYGRGTTDNKAGAATLVANFVRLKQEGFVPSRDIIMVLTGDEESTGNGIDYLTTARRDLIDAEFALNTDAGYGLYDDNGEPQSFNVQTSEKLYQSFELEAKNPGGHSSLPRDDNAIYALAAALGRIAAHDFPLELNDGTRAYFEESAAFEHGETGALMSQVAAQSFNETAAAELAAEDAYFNATLRTTCTATQLQGGHAENALPRSARATVNCRILPGHTPDEVEDVLRRVVNDESISFRRLDDAFPSDPSPWNEAVADRFRAVVAEMWPGTPVIPTMSTGATDGLWVRNAGIPVYGVSAIFGDADDSRAHGLDERIGVEEYHLAVEYWYRLLRAVAE
jgi:acetylornithine deacetylase/succinyl-diaminopimelate desuccinylase-like protein